MPLSCYSSICCISGRVRLRLGGRAAAVPGRTCMPLARAIPPPQSSGASLFGGSPPAHSLAEIRCPLLSPAPRCQEAKLAVFPLLSAPAGQAPVRGRAPSASLCGGPGSQRREDMVCTCQPTTPCPLRADHCPSHSSLNLHSASSAGSVLEGPGVVGTGSTEPSNPVVSASLLPA